VAEAMACGLPVITTDRCGAAEWLREGESGWIVPAGEIDPLAAALEEALRRRSALREMGTVARRQVERFAGESARHALRELVRLHLGTAVSTGAAVESPWPGAIER
jgi:UDP-glucose:(heptosyl)LPS alpha-1,3-glucosyltransferase